MGLKTSVTPTFCIGIMHLAREFLTHLENTSVLQVYSLCHLRRGNLFPPRQNHPKGHYFETIDNIQSVANRFLRTRKLAVGTPTRMVGLCGEFIFAKTIEIATCLEIHRETVKESLKKSKKLLLFFSYLYFFLALFQTIL